MDAAPMCKLELAYCRFILTPFQPAEVTEKHGHILCA